jgi:hypothetical protein
VQPRIHGKQPRTESPKRRDRQQEYEVEKIVSGPRIVDGMYLIKWTGYPDSANTWELRRNLPESVFEDETGPLSFPFEVIAATTAVANAAVLARHKLALTPKPRPDDFGIESSPEGASSHDEWQPGSEETIVDVEEESGGERGT